MALIHHLSPKHPNFLEEKFINCMMWGGKKTIARQIFARAMKIIEKKTGQDAKKVFREALKNVSPAIEVRSRRVGGAVYQIPREVNENRKRALSIRWILAAARAAKGKAMEERLANELIDAFNSTGASMKKREDVHKMADANKAFAFFRRF